MPRWAEADGHDVRPEPLEERRNRLAKLLSRKTKAMRDGIQISEAVTGDGAAIFRHACWMDLEGIVSKRSGSRYRLAGDEVARTFRLAGDEVARTFRLAGDEVARTFRLAGDEVARAMSGRTRAWLKTKNPDFERRR